MCASKIDTHLDGNAVRSKITDFRTALYPRQYHPSALEKPLIQRFFAYKVFFRRTCRRKNEKCGVTAAKQIFKFVIKLIPSVSSNQYRGGFLMLMFGFQSISPERR